MIIPKSENGKIIAIIAERTTGLIMQNNGQYYLGTGTDYYRVFDTINLAKDYIQEEKLKSPMKFEYLIYDHNGIFIELIN